MTRMQTLKEKIETDFVLQKVQPVLLGLMHGSVAVSTMQQ
jgi:hypothetical protein